MSTRAGGSRARGLALAVGAFGQVAQVCMFRENMAAFHGSDLYFGLLPGAHLLWRGVGGLAASVLWT